MYLMRLNQFCRCCGNFGTSGVESRHQNLKLVDWLILPLTEIPLSVLLSGGHVLYILVHWFQVFEAG